MTMPKIADRYLPTGNAQWGGMGQVHECIDENLGRPVMLKTVHRPEDEPRLMDERKALLALRSRHVAQLLDVVSFDHAGSLITCLVLEKIDGVALPTYSTPDRAFLKDAWQIATGLAHIHAAGIIHRDVKPENIKVDANGVVKILDFGLARQHGIDNQTRSIIGSLGFMAPELFGDRTITFSPAVDVFAFGQTVRAMLGETIHGTPPSPLQAGTIVAAYPGLDADVATLLEQCLATDPAQRPAMTHVARELGLRLLKNTHRARIIDSRGKPYELHQGNRGVNINTSSNDGISIRYDGMRFVVSGISGAAYVNNRAIAVGQEMTAACVITLGDVGAGAARAFLTFDVSNPEVMP